MVLVMISSSACLYIGAEDCLDARYPKDICAGISGNGYQKEGADAAVPVMEEIKRLAVHDEQLHNELTGYENSLASLDLMIKKNDRYKELYLYQWVRRDLKKVFRK